MKYYLLLTMLMLSAILALFLLVEALQIPLLVDPGPWLRQAGPAAALISIALLTADVLLPVPASLVMIANGALFGVAPGALISMLGSMSASMLGFYLGRRGSALIDRLIPADERARGDAFLVRWGDIAVIATRPIPMVAETVAILAGTSPMSVRRMLLAAAIGSIPAALLFALTGAVAVTFNSAVWTLLLVLLMSAVFWFAGRRLGRETVPQRAEGRE